MIAMAMTQMDQSKKEDALDLLKQVMAAHASGYYNVHCQYLCDLIEGK